MKRNTIWQGFGMAAIALAAGLFAMGAYADCGVCTASSEHEPGEHAGGEHAGGERGEMDKDKMQKMHAMMKENMVEKAVAVLEPTEGNNAEGTVTFTKADNGIRVEGEVRNLEPDTKHGFHVHQYGDASAADGTAMGGHFNPTGHPHGAPDDEERHAGDFGNIESDGNGVATFDFVDKHIAFHGPMGILGRGLIVHAGADDLESQPTGDAGARIAQAVIGVANTE